MSHSNISDESNRAIINMIKQRYHLNLFYTDEVYGPSQAHVWCGTWTLEGVGVIGTGEAANRPGAKEASAQPAVQWLRNAGYSP